MMKMKFDHDLHIHSKLSECSSDPEQSTARILSYAKEMGLTTICLTDHGWDERIPGASDWYKAQSIAWVKQSKPLPKAEGIEFLFGCETDMDKFFTVGMSEVGYDEFDFVIIPTTHLHMEGFTISSEDKASNRRIAELWVQRLDRLLDMPLPFRKIGIAHLACTLLNNRSHADYLDSLSMISNEDMTRVFTKAARVGVGIELNLFDLNCSDEDVDAVFRMFRIAKECGCKFYFGSDAHHPQNFIKAKSIAERAVDILGLTENDKFHIGR